MNNGQKSGEILIKMLMRKSPTGYTDCEIKSAPSHTETDTDARHPIHFDKELHCVSNELICSHRHYQLVKIIIVLMPPILLPQHVRLPYTIWVMRCGQNVTRHRGFFLEGKVRRAWFFTIIYCKVNVIIYQTTEKKPQPPIQFVVIEQ